MYYPPRSADHNAAHYLRTVNNTQYVDFTALFKRTLTSLLVLLYSTFCLPAEAASFAPGNLLVSHNNSLNEFSLTGTLVQSFTIPHPDTSRYTAGDVVVDGQGRAHVVNYAPFSNSYISTFDPLTDLWIHTEAPVQFGNGSDGDLSILRDTVFRRGVRMDTNTLVVETFDIGMFNGTSETSVGQDMLLYSINSGSPRYRIQRTDPSTLQNVGAEFDVRDSTGSRLNGRGLAVTRDGTLYVADWDGRIYVFDESGTYLEEFATGFNNLRELNLRSDGVLVASSRRGDIVVTDIDFSFRSTFSLGSGVTYSGFVTSSVPEPASLPIAAIVACCVLARRRNRDA